MRCTYAKFQSVHGFYKTRPLSLIGYSNVCVYFPIWIFVALQVLPISKTKQILKIIASWNFCL
jgi:hypothetical protein